MVVIFRDINEKLKLRIKIWADILVVLYYEGDNIF